MIRFDTQIYGSDTVFIFLADLRWCFCFYSPADYADLRWCFCFHYIIFLLICAYLRDLREIYSFFLSAPICEICGKYILFSYLRPSARSLGNIFFLLICAHLRDLWEIYSFFLSAPICEICGKYILSSYLRTSARSAGNNIINYLLSERFPHLYCPH